MKIFNCEELHSLVKKVADEKLIEKCADTFIKKVGSTLHFLSYNEIIEVCTVLDTYTDICHIRPREKYDAFYCFHFIYDKDDFMVIADEAFNINECDCSDYTFKVIFEDEDYENDDTWYPVFLVREFWEFCKNCMNENEDGSEENMNNKITETKTEEETFSIYDIYKIITNSEEFEKIIEGMKDIGFTDETIYKVILNSVKELN